MNRLHRALWRIVRTFRAAKATGLQKGDVIPDFSLLDVEGNRRSISDILPDKSAVLWLTNFCKDCRNRIPFLNDLVQKASDRYGVLAVSLLGNDLRWPQECARTASFPILIDPEDIVTRTFGLSHPPGACPLHNLFIVDRGGRVVYRHHLSALSWKKFRKVWDGIQT